MSNLILHIGYPKTATTTLQSGVFPQLHDAGLINYLGRWTGDSNDPAIKLRQHLLFGKELDASAFPLRDGVPNVISDERLTLCPIYDRLAPGPDKLPTAFPDRLAAIFDGAERISVLLALRNQTSLIYSTFLQRYRHALTARQRAISFGNHIFDEFGDLRYEEFKYFDFGLICDAYAKLVGDSGFRFLFFEELLGDRNEFAASLTKALSVEQEIDHHEVASWLERTHKRKSRPEGNSFRKLVLSPNWLGKRLSTTKSYRSLARSESNLGQTVFRGIRFALMERSVHDVALQSENERNAIAEAFRDPNLRFAEDFGADLAKLQAYGYV